MPARESRFSAMGESAPELDLVLRRPVVLIGMMGAGKTAVGRALSARLGVPLQDSDAEIVESARLSIAEIFERYGEPFFREKEAQVIARLLHGVPCILSTGGGAFLAERNRAAITADGVSLLLKADIDLLWSRVKHKTTRPLLRTDTFTEWRWPFFNVPGRTEVGFRGSRVVRPSTREIPCDCPCHPLSSMTGDLVPTGRMIATESRPERAARFTVVHLDS